MKHEYRVTGDASGQRLDKFLRKRLADVPLSHLYKLVRTKKVRVNGARELHGLALGAAAHRPAEVESRPGPGSAGEDEVAHRGQLGGEAIDLCFQPRDVFRLDARNVLGSDIRVGGRQLAAQIEKLALQAVEDPGDLLLLLIAQLLAGHAEGGIELVHFAVRRHAQGILRDARTAE